MFVGGEQFNPGFLSVSQAVLTESGWGGDLAAVVMDSRTTVFSNYVVARPAFWRNWLRICECVFLLAEDSQLRPQLHSQLNAKTSYGAEAQRKIFVIEGIASLLLTIGGYKSRAFSPFAVPWFSLFSPFRAEALVADALKIAFRETGRQEYLAHFRRLQAQVLSDAIRARIDNVAPDCRATTA